MPLGFPPIRRLAKPIFLRAASMPGRRPAYRSHSTVASRSTSFARFKLAPAVWCLSGLFSARWLRLASMRSRFCRGRVAVCRHHRILRHGAAAGIDALEQAQACSGPMTILHDLLGVASGSVVGFVLGLVGGGGSILAVPLLVYVVGVPVPPCRNRHQRISCCCQRRGQPRRPRESAHGEMAVRNYIRYSRHDGCGSRRANLESWWMGVVSLPCSVP